MAVGSDMRQIMALAVLMAIIVALSGYSSVPETGDFTFQIPEGYELSDVTEKSCTILNSQGAAVGGINLTGLRVGELRGDRQALYQYLNQVADDYSFFSWRGGDWFHPTKFMTLTVTDPETKQTQQFYRLFFVKDSGVYEMWFDLSQIERDAITPFYPIAEAKE